LHQFQQEGADRLIDDAARHALADLLCPPDGGFLADIGGDHLLGRVAVMNAHSLSTNAAYDATLHKRRPFPWRPRFPCSSEPQRVLGEAILIGLKLLPTDVADMNIRNHELPFRPGNLGRAVLAVWQKVSADATIDECAGIARIMQHLEDSRMRGSHPMQLALVQALTNAAGESEALVMEQLRRLHR
jgi:hypothetical protein